ncbi:MAG: PorV/PorQ family protein [Ignavibacteriaceae bacterium]|nr:PorV/PorQ family protein [Ignavibacteriaceae bacterium]NUM70116.1 PorV/PorQ family protein [Ignavibacteriaceae bacterium]
MKIIKVLALGFLMFLGTGQVLKAQGEAAVPFLLIAPDSRGGGIGETGAGLADNSSAIFWNPAGIAFLTGQEFSFTHSNWLPQFKLDLFYDYATYRNYMPDLGGSVTASITYMNYGEFVRTGPDSPDPLGTFRSFDMAATVGYATKLSQDWGFGFNFRLIHSRLSDQPTGEEQGTGTATSVSFDLGFMWRPTNLIVPFTDYDLGDKLSIGLNLSNLGPKISYIDRAQADPIPTNFRLGFAYRIFQDDFNSLTYTLDFSKLLVRKYADGTSDDFYQAIFTAWGDKPLDQELADVVTSMGLEYWYGKPGDFLFALRSGFFYEDPSYGNRKFVTMGAGIRYDLYGFDFSYISTSVFKDGENHPLSDTLRFTILVGWGGLPDNTKGLPRGI